MSKKTTPPPIDPRVVEWLNEVFPDRVPREPLNQYELGLRAGEQRVIDKMKSERDRQQDNILEV